MTQPAKSKPKKPAAKKRIPVPKPAQKKEVPMEPLLESPPDIQPKEETPTAEPKIPETKIETPTPKFPDELEPEGNSITRKKAGQDPARSAFIFPPSELPKLVLLEPDKLPKNLEVNTRTKAITIRFPGTTINVLNTLNCYTSDLRESFATASMPGWKAIFYANEIRYVSTL